MIKLVREGFGDRLQFTISVTTPKTYGDSRSDAIKDFLLKFWKDFVYSRDSDILDDLGIPVTGTTECKCEVDDCVAYMYPRLNLSSIEKQDLSHCAFELNKTNIAKDYKLHFGYGYSSKMKSLYIQVSLPENLRRNSNYCLGPIGTESIKRNTNNLVRENRESVRITAKSFDDMINQIENLWGYDCFPWYSDTRDEIPKDGFITIYDYNGNEYEVEFYTYSDGRYEIYSHNIHPTGNNINDNYVESL